MASILCSKCHQGIHYHGEPNGIQYVMICKTDWDKIVSSDFDSRQKIIDQTSGYPKLYRTDTIEEDFPESVKKFWKCPHCATLHFFDTDGRVVSVYEPAVLTKEKWGSGHIEGWFFDDYKWDELTEKMLPDSKLSSKTGELNELIVSSDAVVMRNADTDMVNTYKILL